MVDLKKGSPPSGQEGDGGGADEGNPQGVTVGEKTYSAEDVKGMINNQAAATQALQDNADLKTTLERYGTDQATYLQQADGAFAVMSDLIASGVINEQGQVIEKKPAQSSPEQQVLMNQLQNQNSSPPVTPPQSAGVSEEAISSIVAKALGDTLGPIQKAITELDNTQTNMIRTTLGEQIKGKFNDLDDRDISQVFANAMNDNSKDLFGHAEVINAEKKEVMGGLRKKYAEEFGVDLDEHDANILFEQGPGGGASVIAQGKKLSFKKSEGAVTPRQAAQEFFQRKLRK